MNLKQITLVFVGTFGLLNVCNVAESALPLLFLPQILAIRLASVTGILPIPYHLNDLFVRSVGKRSLSQKFSRRQANLTIPHVEVDSGKLNGTALSTTELLAMYRLLLGVRRIDTHDCFLKTLCFIGYETSNTTDISFGDRQLLETLNYLTSLEEKLRKTQDQLSKPPIMDVFHKALVRGRESKTATSCDNEYRTCSLSETDMDYESIVADLS